MAIITLVEYAKRNGKNIRSVRDKAVRGQINAFKSGKIWLIDEDEKWVDMRRKGHNKSILEERNAREKNEVYVIFLKDKATKQLHARVGKGLRRDLQKQFEDETGYRFYYSLKYEEVPTLIGLSEDAALDWINQYKDHNTIVKRDAVMKYLFNPDKAQDVINQYKRL